MRFALVLSVFFSLISLVGSGNPAASGQEKVDKEDATKKELAALQGTWECIHWEQDGKLMPDKETRSSNTKIVIDGSKAVFSAEGFGALEGKIEIDVTKTPTHLDFHIDDGRKAECIYVRAGDYVTICNGGGRPTEFVSGSPNGGPSLYVFKIKR